jgi:hypothetical protein
VNTKEQTKVHRGKNKMQSKKYKSKLRKLQQNNFQQE